MQLVNQWARVRAKGRNPRVITRVAQNDDMLTGGPTLKNSFEVGESALNCIRDALHAVGVSSPGRILDLPCGYGRVLRYLRAAWPNADITTMELNADGARFCADTFSAKPVISCDPVWLATGAGEGNHMLWCGSLLTHFDSAHWEPTFRFLRDRLAAGGVLVFTTHGDLSIDLLAGDPAAVAAMGRWVGDYGMGPKARGMARTARENGFAFGQYGNDHGPYGLSVSSPNWVRATVDRVPGLTPMLHRPAGWFGHQDVWTYVRDG